MFPVSSKTLKAGENGRREIAKKNAEKKYILRIEYVKSY